MTSVNNSVKRRAQVLSTINKSIWPPVFRSMTYEERKLYMQEWRKKNPGYRSLEMQVWKAENPDKVKAYRLTETYREARRRYKDRRRQIPGAHTTPEWIDLKAVYGNKCVRCGERQYPGHALTLDHKIPVSLGGTNNIDNLQPLCSRCNSSKGSTTWFAQCPLTIHEGQL